MKGIVRVDYFCDELVATGGTIYPAHNTACDKTEHHCIQNQPDKAAKTTKLLTLDLFLLHLSSLNL
jgi:hypothetical protein